MLQHLRAMHRAAPPYSSRSTQTFFCLVHPSPRPPWPPHFLPDPPAPPCARYDMLAQRERAIHAHFSNVSGRPLSEADLVRSLLLDCMGSADERELAYDSFWRPMEERHGDGDPVVLATFLQMFLARRERAAAPVASPVSNGVEVTAGVAARATEGNTGNTCARAGAQLATSTPLRDQVAALLRDRGGGGGSRDIYGSPTGAAEIVAPEAAARAALSLLREMHDLSLTADVASGAAARAARLVPADLWDPAQQLRRL